MFRYEYDLASNCYWIIDDETGYVIDKQMDVFSADEIVNRLNEENE